MKTVTAREVSSSDIRRSVMLDELQIIDLFFEKGKVPVDDCAFLPASSQIITGDSMVENTHFRLEWHPPELLARKLFQSNISDLAAGGGDPEWCVLQMGVPADADDKFLRRFARAFREECEQHRCRLIGGDTFRNQTYIFSLTMAGKTKRPLHRRARPGDAIFMTGTAGLSLAGLKHLTGERPLTGQLRARALQRHLAPQSRLDWARTLRSNPDVHGMMDLSDGLLQDLERYARAAGLRFHLHLESIPCDEELAAIMPALERAISGEEYELIFCAPSDLQTELPVTVIGRVMEGAPGLAVFQSDSETEAIVPDNRGFEHF